MPKLGVIIQFSFIISIKQNILYVARNVPDPLMMVFIVGSFKKFCHFPNMSFETFNRT